MATERNPVISIARVIGMFFIVLCHIIHYYSFVPGSSFLGQFFICGVQLFIFISGYLYGGKTVTHFGKWYVRRALTVSLPAILLSVIFIVVLFITNTAVASSTIIAYCLDLEGLLFLGGLFSSFFKSIPSLDPLWFTTVIMLCYLLVPILQREKFISRRVNSIVGMSAFLLIGTLLCVCFFSWVRLPYFFFFTIGYFLGKFSFLSKVNGKIFSVYTVLFLLSIMVRMVLNRYIDGTNIYFVYTEFSKFVAGTWIVVLLSFTHRKMPVLLSTVGDWKAVKWFDKYSFYIYLVHGIFCMGLFNLYERFSLVLATTLFVACTVVSAMVLKFVCDHISKVLTRLLKI